MSLKPLSPDSNHAQRLALAATALTAVSETPRLDAELLLAHALGVSRASLLARLRECDGSDTFDTLLARRLNHEPLAYIFGEWEFMGLSMQVQAPLLTPRPETEHLVERALAFLEEYSTPQRALDVCCGTGCVGVAIAHYAPRHHVFAVDIRLDAVQTARHNARRHQVDLLCARGDLLSGFRDAPALDAVVANPPYVPEGEWPRLSPVITRHEDPGALLAGDDGLDIIRALAPQAARRLRPGGLLALEIGEDQADAVTQLMEDAGFEHIQCDRDLAGVERIVSGRLRPNHGKGADSNDGKLPTTS